MLGMFRYKTTWVVLVLLAVAGGAGWYYWRAERVEAPIYREATVKRGDIEMRVTSTAVVQPRNRLEIKPPIAGRIEQVLVREGQTVDKGQVLGWMSSTERAALLDAARTRGAEELARWEELYRPTPIVAPIRGTLIARNTEPGQSFTSADAVFVMSDQLTVKAQVDETDIAQIRVGQPTKVTLDAYPEHGFSGRVEAIAYDAKTVNNVTTYEVDVLPRDAPAFLRSGMTANVNFRVAAKDAVLLIPSTAVKMRDGKPYVLRPPAQPGEPPSEQALQIGLSDGKLTEVTDGLAEGDTVLTVAFKKSEKRGAKGSTNPLNPFPAKRK